MTDQHGRKARGIGEYLHVIADRGNAVDNLRREVAVTAEMLVAFIGMTVLSYEQGSELLRYRFNIPYGQTAADGSSVGMGNRTVLQDLYMDRDEQIIVPSDFVCMQYSADRRMAVLGVCFVDSRSR